MTNDAERVRWRMTFDQLCYECRTTPPVVDRWAELGAFGPRLKEPRDRGWHRHVSREVAQRAVIMSRLIKFGLNERVAAELASLHELGETEPMIYTGNNASITIRRDNLP